GLHEQGQALDHPGFTAIAEMNTFEADLSFRYFELLGIWTIDEGDWAGDGHHAFLDHSDILEDGRNLPGDPARDVDDLPRERESHAHRADLDLALRPQNEGERAGACDHGGVERRKAEAEQRIEPQRPIEQSRVVVEGIALIVVLFARARKQLH